MSYIRAVPASLVRGMSPWLSVFRVGLCTERLLCHSNVGRVRELPLSDLQFDSRRVEILARGIC